MEKLQVPRNIKDQLSPSRRQDRSQRLPQYKLSPHQSRPSYVTLAAWEEGELELGIRMFRSTPGKQQTYHFIQHEMRSNREEEREGGGGSIIHEGNSSTTELAQTHAALDKVTAETRVGNGMPKLCFLGVESREALSPSFFFLFPFFPFLSFPSR